MLVQPYLFFEGRCDEALEFYRSVVGAKVEMLVRYKDSPDPVKDSPGADKVMHANVRIGDSTVFFSDGHCSGKPSFQGFSLSVTVPSEDEARRVFTALSEKGEVRLPLAKTFFSPLFGMLADRFGMAWMVYVVPKH